MEETPKCEDCNEEMVFIGELGKSQQMFDHKNQLIGMRPFELYQCTKCKKVVIN